MASGKAGGVQAGEAFVPEEAVRPAAPPTGPSSCSHGRLSAAPFPQDTVSSAGHSQHDPDVYNSYPQQISMGCLLCAQHPVWLTENKRFSRGPVPSQGLRVRILEEKSSPTPP